MLTRFAQLAVVMATLASLSEARAASGGNVTVNEDNFQNNTCGNALKPDDAKLQEYFAACMTHFNAEDLQAFEKCMVKQFGWVTEAGAFDEAAFRAYVAGKLATATSAVQTHINSRLDGCLNDADMAAVKVEKIMRCLIKDCPGVAVMG